MRVPAGVSVFGLTYTCGFTWAGTAKENPRPLDLEGLIRLAGEWGMEGVEFPARMLGDPPEAGVARTRAAAEAAGLRIVLAGGRVERGHLAEQVRLASQLGAPVVRCVLSGLLCGDRRGLEGGWPAHLERCAAEVEAALPAAERAGVALAVENHQDATSADLVELCRRFESRFLGVTLDTGNPLAVMEEPVRFAEAIAPYLLNVHLKDYRIHRAENGMRLVRCALGDGVIDFPALYALFARQERSIPRSIELGALQARLIPFLEPSWWAEHRPRSAADLLPALDLAWRLARPEEEEWRTAYERDDPPELLASTERQELERSVAYLRSGVQAVTSSEGLEPERPNA